jgi:heat shock protein HslJ
MAIVAVAILVAGCCACRKNRNTVPLVGTEWKLSQLGNEPVVGDNYRMTLAEDGRISGIGDCNRFTGSFIRRAGGTRTSGELTMAENLVSTRMMCLNQARETAFMKVLREADSWSIDGNRLLLIRDGDVLAIFDQTPVTAY